MIDAILTKPKIRSKQKIKQKQAEGQSFAAFLSQLFSLLSRGLGASPPSIPLMGFPALPASFAREKRPRFVSRRAMEALVKVSKKKSSDRAN